MTRGERENQLIQPKIRGKKGAWHSLFCLSWDTVLLQRISEMNPFFPPFLYTYWISISFSLGLHCNTSICPCSSFYSTISSHFVLLSVPFSPSFTSSCSAFSSSFFSIVFSSLSLFLWPSLQFVLFPPAPFSAVFLFYSYSASSWLVLPYLLPLLDFFPPFLLFDHSLS